MYKDKVVWITGASAGIGAGLADAFARRGARVILSARNQAGLEQVHARLPERERDRVLPLDLEAQDTFAAAVARVIEDEGGVDLLVHNAGLSQRSMIADTHPDVYRRLMEINYFGTIALTMAVLPHMVERGSGRFAVISSLAGKFATPLRSGYAASKHALHGWFEALRLEHEKDGIAVTMVCPGFIDTDISVNALTGDGSPQQSRDDAQQNGLSVDVFCRRMLAGLEKNRHEVIVAGRLGVTVWLKRLFPGLLHRILLRARVT